MNGWSQSKFSSRGVTHETFRKGSGPVVIIVHEIPGITPAVEKFANEVVAAGFTVVMPLLVGNFGEPPSGRYMASSAVKVCISREFTTMALNKTSPIISWLRELAKYLHAEIGGKGVGAVGMCFSGGFALGMMVDDIMLAPVLSQPSLPFALGAKRSADLNLSEQDSRRITQRAEAGCQVLGLLRSPAGINPLATKASSTKNRRDPISHPAPSPTWATAAGCEGCASRS